jgi:hypothetical protein
MKIELQETTGAFAIGIPECAWRTISTHRKVATARKAKAAADAAMRERCGPSAWDSHRRLINAGTLRIQLKATYYCHGVGLDAGGGFAEGCATEAEVRYFWLPDEPEPSAPIPDGWYDHTTCRACRKIAAARERERWHQSGMGRGSHW